MSDTDPSPTGEEASRSIVSRFLGWVERVGNRLPDPAALFVLAPA